MQDSVLRSISASFTTKTLVIGVLVGVLLIPLVIVGALVGERAERRNDVRREVGAIWGSRQTVGGLALTVPYEVLTEMPGDPSRLVRTEGRAVLLPATLDLNVVLTPEIRRRSIFSVNLYRAAVTASGTFTASALDGLGLRTNQVFWDRASLVVGVSDLRGLTDVSSATWGETALTLEPAADAAPFASGLRAVAPMPANNTIAFRIEMTVAGTDGVSLMPSGAQTTVRMTSSWPSPGFVGARLPTSHSVAADGFGAEWTSNYLSRPFPQAWAEGTSTHSSVGDRLHASTFGVDLVTTVDHYQQTERAVKYGLLFIVLTFAIFLVWEVVEGLRLHPFQYLLVGAALIVFYLLLLSLAEQWRFALAYFVATAATVGLISTYAIRALGGIRRALSLGGVMSALYGLLFVLLSLEDLALLVGSIAVFVVLAAVMYLTRKVSWYQSPSTSS